MAYPVGEISKSNRCDEDDCDGSAMFLIKQVFKDDFTVDGWVLGCGEEGHDITVWND